jgi:hypothetical protein
VLGILGGLAIGIAVVAAFVFLGSEGTVDAPRITGVDTGKPAATAKPKAKPVPRPRPHPAPTPTVQVVGGAPPASGPVQLHFKRGDRVRFRVDTDVPIGIEIPGYGISEVVESGSVVSFRALRSGQFPVIVADSHIGVAELLVAP